MEGGGPPFAVCPKCGAFVLGPPPCPACGFAPWPPAYFVRVPTAPAYVPQAEPSLPWASNKWWRRTRWGLLLTAVGLLLAWIPYVSAIAVLFLSLGSTFLFLGARGAGRRHEVFVVLAFLLLALGGVLVGIFVSAFLLEAYDAGQTGRSLAVLQDAARLLIWGTLPATFCIAGGFALQVASLLPGRQRWLLLGLCLLLAATASIATVFSDPEVLTLGPTPVRLGPVADFLTRLSFYRMLEAPAYVGLGVLYLTTHEAVGVRGLRSDSAPVAANPGKG